MEVVIAVIVLAGAAILINEMYQRDKARRDREKALEESVRREKRRRMGSLTGDDFWDDD